MKELLKEKRCTRVFVLDTAAFLSPLPLLIKDCLFTTTEVRDEIKDIENYEKMLLSIEVKGVTIVDSPLLDIKLDRKLENRLSRADKSILRLAAYLQRAGSHVVLVTDDYALQEAAQRLGLDFMPVKTMGIKRLSDFK